MATKRKLQPKIIKVMIATTALTFVALMLVYQALT
jgi:hypothetical protein